MASAVSIKLRNLSAEDSASVAELQQWMGDISQQTLRINAVITGIQDFSRSNSQYREVSIGDILDESLSILKHTTRHVLDALNIDCPDNLPKLYVDATQIEQVLVNLVTNASDAMAAVDRPCC
ncbi:MAG: hypothetical protein R3C05_12360 [Pirellulaceae bacterium]